MKRRQTLEEGRNVKECDKGQEFEACNQGFGICRTRKKGQEREREKMRRQETRKESQKNDWQTARTKLR